MISPMLKMMLEDRPTAGWKTLEKNKGLHCLCFFLVLFCLYFAALYFSLLNNLVPLVGSCSHVICHAKSYFLLGYLTVLGFARMLIVIVSHG